MLKRQRHSMGEISCLSIDEFISIPANGNISVKCQTRVPFQAFISLRKI